MIRKLVIGSAAALSVSGLRRVAHSSGATPAEIASSVPGDDLLRDATETIDRATTLPAPPEVVWPWLVQLGKGRAGWYFPAWLDAVTPTAKRGLRTIDPALVHVAVGDDHADWGPGDPVLRVAQFDPPHALVYHSLRDKSAGHRWPADGSADRPDVFAMSWALLLSPSGADASRLHLRLRLRATSSALAAVGGGFDWATVELLFAGLRERLSA